MDRMMASSSALYITSILGRASGGGWRTVGVEREEGGRCEPGRRVAYRLSSAWQAVAEGTSGMRQLVVGRREEDCGGGEATLSLRTRTKEGRIGCVLWRHLYGLGVVVRAEGRAAGVYDKLSAGGPRPHPSLPQRTALDGEHSATPDSAYCCHSRLVGMARQVMHATTLVGRGA